MALHADASILLSVCSESESCHARAEAEDLAADPPRQTIQIELASPLNPDQSLELSLTAEHHPPDWLEQDDGYSGLPLPELRLVGVGEVEGTLLVQAPPDIDVLVSDLSGDLRPETGERLEIPVLVVGEVSRQSGVVALEAAGDQQLAYEPEDLRDIDPADVGEPKAYVPRQRIVAAYQYPRATSSSWDRHCRTTLSKVTKW